MCSAKTRKGERGNAVPPSQGKRWPCLPQRSLWAGIHQRWQSQKKTSLSGSMTNGSPQIHPFLQINLCLTQGLKQHLSAEKKGNGQYSLWPLTRNTQVWTFCSTMTKEECEKGTVQPGRRRRNDKQRLKTSRNSNDFLCFTFKEYFCVHTRWDMSHFI